MLWAATAPGGPAFFPVFLGVPATLVMGLIWVGRLVAWKTDEARSNKRRWLVAPTMVIVAGLLFSSGLPLKARFGFARDDFNAVVADLEPQGSVDDWVRLEVPSRIGSYEIYAAYQVGSGVIFYEINGSGFANDGGFAYLPDGPDVRLESGSFERPSFRSLGGDWYSWSASW